MRYLIVLIALLGSAAASAAGAYDDRLKAWLSERTPRCDNYTHVLSQFSYGPQYHVQLDGFRLQRIEYRTLSRAEIANGLQARGSLYITALMGRTYDVDTQQWDEWWDWGGRTEYRFEVKKDELRVGGSDYGETITYMLNPITCDEVKKYFAQLKSESAAAAEVLAAETARQDAEKRKHEEFIAKYGDVSPEILSTECDGSYYFFASEGAVVVPNPNDTVRSTVKRGYATLFRVEKETGNSYAYVSSLLRSRWGRVSGLIGDVLTRSYTNGYEWESNIKCDHVMEFLKDTWPK